MPDERAEDLLIVFLERRAEGDATDFEAFCAQHPAHAAMLRSLFARLRLAESLGHAAPEASLSDRLRTKFGAHADPGISLDRSDPVDDATLVQNLKSRGPASNRYHLRGEVAHGGMGAILRVFDKDLRRHLAMKVILDGKDQYLPRFLEEAQVTGQLDHPGIVPVHELGLDAGGRVYFTMKLVKGETLTRVFERVATGEEGWNPTRALSVILRVCEAMAFAHDKGVIHRDLKPSNIMVGKFGETYVMDWGLARVLGAKDSKDVRIRPDASTYVETGRRATKGATPESPLYTMDGEALGTPAYMPPEQAKGELDKVGAASDVYAVGAILYHLISGQMPYVEPGSSPSPHAIVAMVMHAAPPPVHTLVKDVPAELAAIQEKAMARRIEDRYASMAEFADDLRAYLERRVVKAYETGAIAEIKKWVVRNRGLAAAALVAVLAIAGGLVGVSLKNAEITAQKNFVVSQKAEFDQLAGVVLLEDAKKAEEGLYPAWPEKIPAMEHWLKTDWRKLEELKPVLAQTIAQLEERALPWTDAERESDRTTHPDFEKLKALGVRLEAQRRAQAVRVGRAHAEVAILPDGLAGRSAWALVDFAYARVRREEEDRIFGEEASALAASREAVVRIEAGDASDDLAVALDTLGWALFANGLDAEARATEARALEIAAPEKKEDYERRRANLEHAIVAATGPEATQVLARAETEVARLESSVNARRSWRFEREDDRFLHDTLAKLSSDIAAFVPGAKQGVEQRLAWAQKIGDLTLHHKNARVTWDDVRAALAKADGVVASTLYRESPIDLKPQTGLVPIGMNPVTKLWEFYELRSACDLEASEDPAAIEIPTFENDGSIAMKNGTGIVFVLIPGGTFWQGAQAENRNAPNFDPEAFGDERPLQPVTLEPHFIARHELTKGQWKRLTGGDEPSEYEIDSINDDERVPISWIHPVENVSWSESARWLRRSGLALPTEAQWEYGARGGTNTPWWTGVEASSLAGAANVMDLSGAAKRPECGRQVGDFDDGFVQISPVGRFRANAFGLFDVHGNIREWCADTYFRRYVTPQSGDGLRRAPVSGSDSRVYRGGGFFYDAFSARCADRLYSPALTRLDSLGLRPARILQ